MKKIKMLAFITTLFFVIILASQEINVVNANESVLKQNSEISDFMRASTIKLVAQNYTKRVIDITYLAMGDEVGHNHVYETKYDNSIHWKECIICNNKIESASHTYSETWTLGDSCSYLNKLVHACSCGYSYQTGNTRAHRSYEAVKGYSSSRHQIGYCGYCDAVEGSYVEKHYDAGGELGCGTGRSGTCSKCGLVISAGIHESWIRPMLVNGNTYEAHGNISPCNNCGKNLITDIVSTVSYNGNKIIYDMTVTYPWDMSKAQSFNATAVFYPNNTGTVTNSSYKISGNKITYHIEGQMIDNYERSTILCYNPAVVTGDGTRFSIHQDAYVVAEKTPPTISNISQRDITSYEGWSTSKEITITGTENYCGSVTISVTDDDGNVYVDNASAIVNNRVYTYSFIPQIEADENGKELTVTVKDKLENTYNQKYTVYKIDNYTPTFVGDMTFNTPWSKSKDITFCAKDGGIKNIKIGFNDEADLQLADEVDGLYQREYTFVGDVYGQTVARVYAEDAIGNITSEYVKIGNLDNTAPTITSLNKNLNVREDYATLDVTVNSNDINSQLGLSGSGVTHYAITTSNDIPDEDSDIWQEDNLFSIAENGTYYLWAKDLVGNVSISKELVVTELTAEYKVKHYIMNVDGVEYTLKETEEFTGNVREEVTPNIKEYTGFTSPETETKRVSEDGTTIIEYYYTRNKYNVNLTKDIGVESLIGNGEYYYESDVIIDANLKEGYVWDKWTGDKDVLDKQFKIKMPDNNVTYNANTLKQSNVLTKYVDENTGLEIPEVDGITTIYIEGNNYTTDKKEIPGYTYTKDTENTSGVVGREYVEVIYYYKKNSSVTVKYVDMLDNNKEISEKVIITGLQNDDYETEQKEISGFIFVETEGETNGKMAFDPTEVIYKYKKASNVTVKYIDENTDETIIDDVVKTYKEADIYTTEEKTFEGYELINKTENTSGTVGRENIEVVYTYKKVSAGVEIKYIDQLTGDEIATKEVKTGLEKTPYTSIAKEIDGYELVVTPQNSSGEMTVEKITVVYEYRKNSYVITKYVNENNGYELETQKSKKYKEGDSYTTEKLDIEGYTYTRDTENTEGTVERKDITVTYYYKKNTSVTVKYIDMLDNNKEIVEKVLIPGLENEDYETEQKEISGYIFVETEGVTSGKMSQNPTEVIYKYKKASKLITKHIDANTNENIIEDIIKTYKEGEEYEAYAQNLSGYVLVQEPDEKTGVMGREDVEKTFYYKKISGGLVVKYVDRITGNLLDQEKYTGNENDNITLEEKTFLGYVLDERPNYNQIELGVDSKEITFYYKKSIDMDVIGIDQEIGEEIYSTKISGIEGDTYTTTGKTVDGYELVKTPENATGTFDRNNTKVTYEYIKIGEVKVRYIDKETNTELDSYTISGKSGDNYTTEEKEFKNYYLVEVVGEQVGIIKGETKEVIYYYELKMGKVIVRYVDEKGNELLKEELEGKVGQEYKAEIKEIANYEVVEITDNTQGKYVDGTIEVEIKYKKLKGKIVVKFVDKDGNVLSESYVIQDEVEKEFYYELPEIEGYKIIGDKIIKATFSNEELVFKAKYEKIIELPVTGDINILVYTIILISCIAIITKKIVKE